MRISGMKTGLDIDSLVKQLMEAERKPMDSVRKRKSTEEQKTSAWSDLTKKLESLRDVTEKMKAAATFAERKINLSEETIASVTAGANAQTGSLDLNVRSLATSHRVETGIFSSLTTALGFSGTIFVDGKAVDVSPEDTLESVQTKIIQQNISAVCRAVKLADDQYKLVITSKSMGAASAIGYVDSGTATYAVTSSNEAVATAAVAGNAAAGTYKVIVNSLANTHHIQSDAQVTRDVALGYSGTLTVNGANLTINGTASLNDIAATINGVHAGVTASVYEDGGAFRLRLLSNTSGKSGEISMGDPSGILRGLGVLTGVQAPKNVLVAGSDASYSINGASHTAPGNLVTSVPGLNLTLTGTGTSTVAVSATGGVLRGLGILDSAGNLAHETAKAQDAEFSIDGYVFRRGTNNITDAVPGLTINLKKAGQTTVEVAEASEELVKTIKDWVGKYNDAVTFLRDKTKYDLKSKTSQALTSDSLAKDLLSKLQLRAVYSVPGLTSFNSVDDIGITVGKYNTSDAGKLVIDEEKLKEKLEANRTDIMKMFGAPTADVVSPTDGVAYRMYELIHTHIESRTGLVPRHTDSLNLSIDNIQRTLDDWEIRMAKRESELYRKYTRMETALTRLQNQMGTLNRLI